MRIYVAVTGSLFGLLVVSHLWRMVVERSVASDPFFLVITTVAAALAVWAGRLVLSAPRA